jgi:hypothetical protein
MFLWGSKTKGLAFRLHQFISQGGSVYTTAEPAKSRELTLEGQYATTEDRLLYPLVFCRNAGRTTTWCSTTRRSQRISSHFYPTQLDFNPDESVIQEGYLTLNEPGLWHESEAERLPDTWFRETKREGRVPKQSTPNSSLNACGCCPMAELPTHYWKELSFGSPLSPLVFASIAASSTYCRKSEFTKLSRLSSEGRSTTTTLLCLSTVNRLKSSNAVEPTAQKVLQLH